MNLKIIRKFDVVVLIAILIVGVFYIVAGKYFVFLNQDIEQTKNIFPTDNARKDSQEDFYIVLGFEDSPRFNEMNTSNKWLVYENEKDGYSFRYPDYWRRVTGLEATTKQWLFNIQIFSTDPEPGQSAEQYIKSYLKKLYGNNPAVKRIFIGKYKAWRVNEAEVWEEFVKTYNGPGFGEEGGFGTSTYVALDKDTVLVFSSFYDLNHDSQLPDSLEGKEYIARNNKFLDQTVDSIIKTIHALDNGQGGD